MASRSYLRYPLSSSRRALIALWSPAASSEILYDAVWQTLRYPPDILARPFRIAFVSVVPLTFVAAIPTLALTTSLDWRLTIAAVALSAGSVIVTAHLWRVGIRRYTGVTG